MSESLEQSDLREGYKTVKLGPREIPIPDEWDVVHFDEAIELNPKYDKPDNGPFDYLPMDAVDEEKQTIEYWTQREKDDCTTTWFKNGDTVYAKITPCTENGKITFIEGMSTDVGSGSTEFLVFHPLEGVTDERFVYYLSNLPEFRSVTISLMEGSTGRQRVPSDVFKGTLNIPLPPLPEQRRIVDILSTVDKQIQQTDEIIETAMEVKGAVANRLFKQGIRDTEQERVQLGPKSVSLPKDWGVTKLSNIDSPEENAVQTGPYQLGDVEFKDSGLRVYGQSNVTSDDYDSVSNHISEDLKDEFSRYEIEGGDVLLTRMGTVGDASLFPDNAQPGILSYHLLRIRPDQTSCWSPYLHHVLNSGKIVMDQIKSLSHGSIMDGLNVSTIRQVRIPMPSLAEQKKIAQVLDQYEIKIKQERQSKEELQELKRGLMQDLLTGRVRVNAN